MRLGRLAVIIGLAATGCIRREETTTVEFRRLDDPFPVVRAFEPCALPPIGDTSQWRPDEVTRLAMPAGFHVDAAGFAAEPPFHGGKYWKDDAGRTFRMVSGVLALDFPAGSCQATLNGTLTAIALGSDSTGFWLQAWPLGTADEPMYHARGFSAADQQLFLRILQTYRAPVQD